MNKKANRNNLRAPTTQPAASIAPSGTLTQDGELPLSASNGVTAPEPLAAHDVLHAALAPLPGDAPAASTDTETAPADEAPAVDAVAPETPAAPAAAKPRSAAKKKADKPAKADAAEQVDGADQAAPAKPAKAPKIKFVKTTFALPESEAELLDAMKKTHQANGLVLKKSQLLRAGLLALADIDAERLTQLVAHLPAEPRASKKKK